MAWDRNAWDWTRYTVGDATAFTDVNNLIVGGLPADWESMTIAAPGADKSAWGDGAWFTWPALQTDGVALVETAESLGRRCFAQRVVSDPSVANSGIVIRFGLFNGTNRATLSGIYIQLNWAVAGVEPVVGIGGVNAGVATLGVDATPSGTSRQLVMNGLYRTNGNWQAASGIGYDSAGAWVNGDTTGSNTFLAITGPIYCGLEIGRANVATASTLGLRVGSIIDPEPTTVPV